MVKLFVSLETLEGMAAKYNLPLCSECLARYEPAVAVALEEDAGAGVLHVWSAVCMITSEGEVRLDRYVGRCCGTEGTWKRWRCMTVPNGDVVVNFLPHIAKLYPEIVGRPLTARLLQELGCDIEVELAVWSLSK
jgi:hypothetical protein